MAQIPMFEVDTHIMVAHRLSFHNFRTCATSAISMKKDAWINSVRKELTLSTMLNRCKTRNVVLHGLSFFLADINDSKTGPLRTCRYIYKCKLCCISRGEKGSKCKVHTFLTYHLVHTNRIRAKQWHLNCSFLVSMATLLIILRKYDWLNASC